VISLTLRPLRFLLRAFTDQSTPHELALGFALGAAVGLMPKDNLLAAGLMTVLAASRVNLGMAAVSALLFSWVAVLTDPLTHSLGMVLLGHDALTPFWSRLADLPVVPWTRFNNTVVLGSFVLGLVLLYPLYRVSRSRFAVWKPRIEERLLKYRLFQWLLGGAELAGRLRGA
jgi:uncharacterized protein (TIGR03546 family)